MNEEARLGAYDRFVERVRDDGAPAFEPTPRAPGGEASDAGGKDTVVLGFAEGSEETPLRQLAVRMAARSPTPGDRQALIDYLAILHGDWIQTPGLMNIGDPGLDEQQVREIAAGPWTSLMIPVDGRPTVFEALQVGTASVAIALVEPSWTVMLLANDWSLQDLRLARVVDLEPYLAAGRVQLEEALVMLADFAGREARRASEAAAVRPSSHPPTTPDRARGLLARLRSIFRGA